MDWDQGMEMWTSFIFFFSWVLFPIYCIYKKTYEDAKTTIDKIMSIVIPSVFVSLVLGTITGVVWFVVWVGYELFNYLF